jgi:hypothetical protein
MDTLLYITVGVVGIAVGASGGFLAGRAARERGVWLTWALAAAILLIGIAFASYGQIAQIRPVWSWAMGLIAGGLTGLKYGRGGVFGRARVVSVDESRATPSQPPANVLSEPEVDADAEPDITRH